MFYSTAPPACSLLTILLPARMHKLYILYFSMSIVQYTTGSHYSRSTSHSTVLRGSCLLYYHTCHCVCNFRSGLSATAIKEYCILYCILYKVKKHS